MLLRIAISSCVSSLRACPCRSCLPRAPSPRIRSLRELPATSCLMQSPAGLLAPFITNVLHVQLCSLPMASCAAGFMIAQLMYVGNLQKASLRHVTSSKGRCIRRQWLHFVRSFHKELGQHESRSAAELNALKKSNAQADDELGRSVESIVARQAQLRGDVRAQQDFMRSNETAISRLQSEACCCSMSCENYLMMLLHSSRAASYPHLGTPHVQRRTPRHAYADRHAGVAVLMG